METKPMIMVIDTTMARGVTLVVALAIEPPSSNRLPVTICAPLCIPNPKIRGATQTMENGSPIPAAPENSESNAQGAEHGDKA